MFFVPFLENYDSRSVFSSKSPTFPLLAQLINPVLCSPKPPTRDGAEPTPEKAGKGEPVAYPALHPRDLLLSGGCQRWADDAGTGKTKAGAPGSQDWTSRRIRCGGTAEGMHSTHAFVVFGGFFLSKAGASQELKGPSDLFVVRSLKCASDVFAYLKIRERQEDKREECVHGKH